MKKIQLKDIAHARSGDKGDTANIGLIAIDEKDYALLKEKVTAAKVKEHFKEICEGTVTRYEMDNIAALNFVLTKALAGGGTTSLRTDAQGKTLGAALLRMWIEV